MKSIFVAFIGFIVLPLVLAERVARIVGGHNAQPHEYPFLVSINLDNKHNCGGTIISKLFILTAGHCLYGYKLRRIFIKAGKHNIFAIEKTEQIRHPAKIIIHEKYDDKDDSSPDIALLKLNKPLQFTDSVKSIPLPTKNTIPRGRGTIMGWGYTFKNGKTAIPPQILQKAVVPILPNDVCAKTWKDFVNYNIFFCTGPLDGRIDSCDGDSGGPLVQDLAGSRTVIGIVSFGEEDCGTPENVAFFTKIPTYIYWINKNMK